MSRLFDLTWFPLVGTVCVALILQASTAPKQALPSDTSHLSVPDNFTVRQVAGEGLVDFPTFATFDNRGRLFVVEATRPNTMGTEKMKANPHHRIKILKDVNDDGSFDTSHVFADSLPFPEGGAWYRGSFYIAAAPDLLRLTDTTGDGTADQREVVLTGWTLNANGAVLSGPFIGPDGWFYMADARRGFSIQSSDRRTFSGKGARIWRSRPDGSRLEWLAGGGFDNAIDIGFTAAGETIGTMTYFTNPAAGQRDALMHWVEGGVYPKPHPVIQEDSLPRTGPLMPVMTRLARVAHSGLAQYDNPHFGPAYQGNLFTAQFNTGRVMRYELSRDGATFTTTEQQFLTTDDPDFHPTDVIVDPDGSLLVVDTGGWFIDGCPLSRVTKPEVTGGIYRIERTDGETLYDPRGRTIEWTQQTPHELIQYLRDRRPAVREHATERLVAEGTPAVAPLERFLHSNSSPDRRAQAVFVLHRIGTPPARAIVRQMLSDPTTTVQIAAARAAGLARDTSAVPALTKLLDDSIPPPVRRQAATALGQIGKISATRPLLDASASTHDRFVEHAIIYALIKLGDTDLLIDHLFHDNPQIQTAALSALSEIERAPLTQDQVGPLLQAENEDLRRAAVRVVSARPTWVDLVVAHLDTQLRADELADAERTTVRELGVDFCNQPELQTFITQSLNRQSLPQDRKTLLLDVVQQCSVDPFPDPWIQQLAEALDSAVGPIRKKALQVIESRPDTILTRKLATIAANTAEPIAFRMDALSARLSSQSSLNDELFSFLIAQLDRRGDPSVRQAAAQNMARAHLSPNQLLYLAENVLENAEPTILSRLITPFRRDSTLAVGRSFVRTMKRLLDDQLRNLSRDRIIDTVTKYPEPVRQNAQPLLARLQALQNQRLKRLEGLEDQLSRGDVGSGRQLFFSQKAQCGTCHSVGRQGGDFGPDLTNIGEIRSRHNLLEAILYPSVSFSREYQTYQVKTSSRTYTGIVSNRTAAAVVLRPAPNSQVRIPREEIISVSQHPTSMMPQGLEQGLTNDELSDLLAFLDALPGAARWPKSKQQSTH